MTKKEIEFLEKIFAKELESVGGNLSIFQGKNKTLDKLEEEGYIMKHKIYLGGRFPVAVTGYVLTIKGNYTYCSSLKEENSE